VPPKGEDIVGHRVSDPPNDVKCVCGGLTRKSTKG
jgi:hypothetical protein